MRSVRSLTTFVTLLTTGLAAVGCEPASVTEARDQLSRGPARSVQLSLPITSETLTADTLLDSLANLSTMTIGPDNLLAAAAAQQFLTVSTGDTIGSITGVLDPAVLNFTVEEWVEITRAGLNLGEFEDAARDATINSALTAYGVSNSADAPLALTGFTLGLVQLDAGGQPLRDMGGNLIYEQNAGGPILVDVEDSPGAGVLNIGRTATVMDSLQAAALVDRLVDLLLGGTRVALAGAGTAAVGDNTVGTVSATDQLVVDVTPIIGFDLTVPPAGIAFDTSIVGTGLNMDPADADATAQRVDSAEAVLVVVNGVAFGLEVTAAVVPGSITGDPFADPSRVELDTLTVAPASVDGNGRVTQATSDTTVTIHSGVEAQDLTRILVSDQFTVGIRIRLLPPSGGRGALRSGDSLVIRAGGNIFIRTGGGQ